MLHDGGQRHRERLRKLADGDAFAPFQFREQRAPCGIGDGGKRAVQAVWRIVNHMVKYRRDRNGVKGAFAMAMPYGSVAAVSSFTASSLAHSAGPAMVAISQPAPSTSTEVGMPSARPTALRSWNTLALGSLK